MTNWFSNVFGGGKANGDAQYPMEAPSRVRTPSNMAPKYENFRDDYRNQQPSYTPVVTEIRREDPPRPPPPSVKVDAQKQVRAAVDQIRKVQREARVDDSRWLSQAKGFLAQERTEEAESLINSLIDSKLFQRQMDKIIISVQTAGRNARTTEAVNFIMRNLHEIIHVNDNNGEPIDIEQITMDLSAQNEKVKDTTQIMTDMNRANLDPTGSESNAERARIRNIIISDLRKDLNGSLPTPAVTQLQNAPAQPTGNTQAALLAQLG